MKKPSPDIKSFFQLSFSIDIKVGGQLGDKNINPELVLTI